MTVRTALVITVSDRAPAGTYTDRSGPLAVDRVVPNIAERLRVLPHAVDQLRGDDHG